MNIGLPSVLKYPWSEFSWGTDGSGDDCKDVGV